MIIDFHTHAFEDELAQKAIPFLEEEGHCKATTDGRAISLVASMDRAGIDRSVVCPIATKPSHYHGIRKWALQVRATQPRLEMLMSIHPDDPDALSHIDEIAQDGFKGIKMHPYYQNFTIDDPRLFPLYERLAERGLFTVFHTGFDLAYPPDRVCDPVRVRHIIDALPEFKLVATHLGGWRDWENSRKYLIGQPVYIGTSYSLHDMPPAEARAMILDHPMDRILFGTDSPWADQTEELARWEVLNLPADHLAAALGGNAERLLQ